MTGYSTATHALVGAWRLKSFVFTPNDPDGGDGGGDRGGEVHHPLGRTPAGSVLFTADGHLTLSFMAGDRPGYAADEVLAGSEAERAAAARSYVSFGGPYRIEDDLVVVEVEHAFHPNWAGGVQRRRFRVAGDTLTLQTVAPISVLGRELYGKATLERAGN